MKLSKFLSEEDIFKPLDKSTLGRDEVARRTIREPDAIQIDDNTFKSKKNGDIFISVPTTVVPLHAKHYRHYTSKLLKQHIAQADSKYEIVDIQYVYKQPKWLKVYLKFTQNRLWYIELKMLQKWVWNRIWNKLRFAEETNGHHAIACIRKL